MADTSKPAFSQSSQIGMFEDEKQGMSLRDYFAAKAMQGLIATYRQGTNIDGNNLVVYSYQMADQMLKEREK